MEIRKIDVDALSVPEILSLLEIARGISSVQPDWMLLKRELARYEAWGFYDRKVVLGYALISGSSPYLGGSVQIVELKYRWEYNQESTVAQMLREIARTYQGSSDFLVMDIDLRRDLNRNLYQKLGFTTSVMQSPMGRDHGVLFAQMDSLLKRDLMLDISLGIC